MSTALAVRVPKKRGGKNGVGKMDEKPRFDAILDKMDPMAKSKLENILLEFFVQQRQRIQELEDGYVVKEKHIRDYFRNLTAQIPADIMQMKMGDFIVAGGSLHVVDEGYAIQIFSPDRSVEDADEKEYSFTAPSPVPLNKKGQVFHDISLMSNSGKKSYRTSKRPHSTAKKNVTKLASKPSQQLLNSSIAHNCSLSSTASARVLRSTARKPKKPKLGQELKNVTSPRPVEEIPKRSTLVQGAISNNCDDVFSSAKTPGGSKMFTKPARKPLKSEDVIIVSKSGTPLLVDEEWLKKRFRMPSDDIEN